MSKAPAAGSALADMGRSHSFPAPKPVELSGSSLRSGSSRRRPVARHFRHSSAPGERVRELGESAGLARGPLLEPVPEAVAAARRAAVAAALSDWSTKALAAPIDGSSTKRGLPGWSPRRLWLAYEIRASESQCMQPSPVLCALITSAAMAHVHFPPLRPPQGNNWQLICQTTSSNPSSWACLASFDRLWRAQRCICPPTPYPGCGCRVASTAAAVAKEGRVVQAAGRRRLRARRSSGPQRSWRFRCAVIKSRQCTAAWLHKVGMVATKVTCCVQPAAACSLAAECCTVHMYRLLLCMMGEHLEKYLLKNNFTASMNQRKLFSCRCGVCHVDGSTQSSIWHWCSACERE